MKRVNIIVSDDGPGVPEGQQNKIFQAFYQLPDDPVATSTGTGIGLAFDRKPEISYFADLQELYH